MRYLLLVLYSTVWKFLNFSIIKILREINFGDSRCAKHAILTHLLTLNLDLYEFLELFEG